MTTKRAVVFDFAGVVFHWNARDMLRRTLPHRATDEAAITHWLGQLFENWGGGWAEFDRGAVEVPVLVEAIAARTGLPPAEVQRVVDTIPHELQPHPPTVDLIARLHDEGVPLYFLSNMPEPYARHLEERNPFLARFADGIFSARVGAVKPEPAIFEIAEGRFGLEPARTVFIDDHAPNVEVARERGWAGVVFGDAAQVERDVRAFLAGR